MLNGEYSQPEPLPGAALTFVPPSIIGPPEKIHTDMKDTDSPGLILGKRGAGEFAWLPWDTGALYYRHSLPAHAALLRDLVDRLLQGNRQLRTNAHPLVEVSLMRQQGRTLLHIINLTGQSQTAYFAPVPLTGLDFDLEGEFRSARALRGGAQLTVTVANGRSRFRLASLKDYDLVLMESR
jgi:hypothetical protein